MEIKIYHEPVDDFLKRQRNENTIGCLFSGLILLLSLFIFLTILPFLLTFLLYLIVFMAIILVYKMYLERHILNFMQKHNLRR